MSEKMYRISLSVPLGIREGLLYLHEKNGIAEGWLEVVNYRNYLTGTISKEGAIEFSGKLETLVESLSYTAVGHSCEGKIVLTLKTATGTYPVTGEEVHGFENIL